MFLETAIKIDSNTKYIINSPISRFNGQISATVTYDNAKRPKSEPNSLIAYLEITNELSLKYKLQKRDKNDMTNPYVTILICMR